MRTAVGTILAPQRGWGYGYRSPRGIYARIVQGGVGRLGGGEVLRCGDGDEALGIDNRPAANRFGRLGNGQPDRLDRLILIGSTGARACRRESESEEELHAFTRESGGGEEASEVTPRLRSQASLLFELTLSSELRLLRDAAMEVKRSRWYFKKELPRWRAELAHKEHLACRGNGGVAWSINGKNGNSTWVANDVANMLITPSALHRCPSPLHVRRLYHEV